MIAVSAASNRSKADQDPATWQPPAAGYRCTYATDWIAIKTRWGLTIDPNGAPSPTSWPTARTPPSRSSWPAEHNSGPSPRGKVTGRAFPTVPHTRTGRRPLSS